MDYVATITLYITRVFSQMKNYDLLFLWLLTVRSVDMVAVRQKETFTEVIQKN